MANARTGTPDGVQQVDTTSVNALAASGPLAPPNQAGADLNDGAPPRYDEDASPAQEEIQDAQAQMATEGAPGIGIEGEFTVWEARYSFKNFIGRIILRALLTLAYAGLAYYAWGTAEAGRTMQILALIAGGALVLLWLHLGWKILYARLSHFYRLTNKRLFVWTGVFQRRLDQVELVKINDVYTKQPSLFHRWMDVGTVVVESSEEKLPITYIVGVDLPEKVLDTVWHTSRAEREGHAIKIDHV